VALAKGGVALTGDANALIGGIEEIKRCTYPKGVYARR
jgi:hypothetical protein